MYIAREYDASWREPMWQRTVEELGGDDRAREIVDAFKTLYTMYTDDVVEWYASLYDPGFGAFYCTTSGRENEGYLPDIESTIMALRFLSSSGMLSHVDGDWRRVMSDDMKCRLVTFIRRMQEPNGYFYNLLLPREALDAHGALARRGRDLVWCTDILRELGETPDYDTPNGMVGRRSAQGLASEGKPTASTNYPDYLESRESVLEYLNCEVDIVGRSYYYGNQLAATSSQIKARSDALLAAGADYSLCDVLISWLNERINPDTGYWSPEPTFAGTNGYFKAVRMYNTWGCPYPEPYKAAKSVLDGILGDEPSTTNICEVYNLWSALTATGRNVELYHTGEERDSTLALIREIMMDRGAEAILNSYRKQSAYQKPDGGWAHQVVGSAKVHQGGIPVGLGGEESNVDAIGKATTGLTSGIFAAYGITPVPIFHEREWQIFKRVMDSTEPTSKPGTKTYR